MNAERRPLEPHHGPTRNGRKVSNMWEERGLAHEVVMVDITVGQHGARRSRPTAIDLDTGETARARQFGRCAFRG